jgi:sugar/nucleoside kinase (ribokinase family)
MDDAGARFQTSRSTSGNPTGRSLILVTPDGERTMNTFLGASHELSEADIEPGEIGDAAITFLEGFLWDPQQAKRAFIKAAGLAHDHGRRAVLALSDAFCVDRYRAEFLELMRTGTVHAVLANAHEVRSLNETADFEAAIEQLRADCPLGVVTMSEQGALAVSGTETVRVPAFEVERVIDATGAGDQFAAGFLLALARGRDLEFALRLGCLSASEIITHIGARPQASLAALAKAHGLSL